MIRSFHSVQFLIVLICLASPSSLLFVKAFDIPNPFAGLMTKPPPAPANASFKSTNTLKPQILKAISNTSNGKTADLETQKRVLTLVRTLEKEQPVSDTLLTNPIESKQLDGVWNLQYTSASEIDGVNDNGDIDIWTPDSNPEDKIDTKRYNNKGTVGAVGIKVETANRVTKQIFDVSKSTVANSVEQDFGIINVGGSFRPSASVPNRAIAAFDQCRIELNNGFIIDLGFVFAILAKLCGSKDNGWLETTYLDDDMRIGRGNKGSLFILTRDLNAVEP